MSKIKNHYSEELEALSYAEPVEQEELDNVLAFEPKLTDEDINNMSAELEHLEGEEFWSKLYRIEDELMKRVA